ncbi:4Fe-4S dicluster domain-containing protein [Solimonas soli]|uniref:4Fe-4S dicluster domain-containing protein n=1 Tax=Solimonas soli TaxID=413479 RepID=UPI0004B10189|nr:ferredoxin family protein [Solimonas soli]
MIELVFEDRCTQCGKCEELCPSNVFDIGAKGFPVIARQEECSTCYLCEAHCPADALYVGPLRTPQPVTHEHVLKLEVLGDFRRGVGFDRFAPGAYSYGEQVERTGSGPLGARDTSGANAAIYAALDTARERGLVDIRERKPIAREIVI